MKENEKIIKHNLSDLIKKFSKSDVITDMEKEYQIATAHPLKVELIDDNSYLKKAKIKDSELKSLGESIKENGLYSPLIVREKKDHFEVVLGRKRLLAAKALKMETIPSILTVVSDEEMLIMLVASVRDQRFQNVIELALLSEALTKKYGYTQTSIASLTHQSRSQITNISRLLTLPDNLISDISTGKLSYGHAKVLVSLPEDVIFSLVKDVYDNDLSVRELEVKVTSYKKNVDTSYIDRLNGLYDCKVSTTGKKITFAFDNEEKRDEFISLLSKDDEI